MNENKLSVKDILYIKDIFNWNYIAIKKYELYIDLCDCDEINKKLNELIQMHVDFCKSLIKVMEGCINK